MVLESEFNIFDVLNVRLVEDPHDRMVAWLCDPNGGHGIPDFSYAIIQRLWGHDFDEALTSVRRQFKLTDESWPDIGVEFSKALLIIENKVQASALREGQIELQNQLGHKRQGDAAFFHCVLCPDRLLGVIPEPSESFRKLPYSVLAEILESRLGQSSAQARPILDQYVAFIRRVFGALQPHGVRMAGQETILRRNSSREPWAWEQVLEQVQIQGNSDLASAHKELFDLLISMADVEPRFNSVGNVDRTYVVHLVHRDIRFVLQVYGDGRLYVSWEGFFRAGQMDAVHEMQKVWGSYLKGPSNRVGSFTLQPLGGLRSAEVASLLQETANRVLAGV